MRWACLLVCATLLGATATAADKPAAAAKTLAPPPVAPAVAATPAATPPPAAPTDEPAKTPPTQSIMLPKPASEEGLEFDVHLQQRSLRDKDPSLDKFNKLLPDLETHSVPFKQGFTEKIVDDFKSRLKDGPPPCQPNQCTGDAAVKQRLHQMDTDYGPEDDWTWTPPAGQ